MVFRLRNKPTHPLAHVDRMLDEFPWLWRTRSRWDAEREIVVIPIENNHLGWCMCGYDHGRDSERTRCWIRVDTEWCREVVEVKEWGSTHHNMSDVLRKLREEGIAFEHMTHVVRHREDSMVTEIFKPQRGETFATLLSR